VLYGCLGTLTVRDTAMHLHLIGPAIAVICTQAYLVLLTNYLEAARSYKALAVALNGARVCQLLFLWAVGRFGHASAAAVLLTQAVATMVVIVGFHRIAHDVTGLPQHAHDARRVSFGVTALIGLGWALPLGYVANWALATGDRYVLDHFVNRHFVGIYAMNYGLWSIPFLVVNGSLEVSLRSRLYSAAAEGNWLRVLHLTAIRGLVGILICTLGITALLFFGSAIAMKLVGSQYWAGPNLMLTIALAHTLYVVGYAITPLFLCDKRSGPLLAATSIAAVACLSYDLAYVPSRGLIAAAEGTFVGYLVRVTALGIFALCTLPWLKSMCFRRAPTLL